MGTIVIVLPGAIVAEVLLSVTFVTFMGLTLTVHFATFCPLTVVQLITALLPGFSPFITPFALTYTTDGSLEVHLRDLFVAFEG